MKKRKISFLTYAAMIAALYVLLTALSWLFGLDKGAVQFRISEMLTILPYFTPAAIPGLFAGCLLSNIFVGAPIWDIIFGSIATLLGAIFTRKLRAYPVLATIPPILSNALIIPFVLHFAYGIPGSIPYFMLTVGLGEVISCGVLGLILYSVIKKHPIFK